MKKDSRMLQLQEREKELSKRTLGDFVRGQRLKLGYKTQEAFANKAGVARPVISKLEAGNETGSMESLAAIARVFGIRPGVLMDIYVGEPAEPEYNADVMRLARKLNQLPAAYLMNLEGLIDTFLKETEQYKNAKEIVKGESQE